MNSPVGGETAVLELPDSADVTPGELTRRLNRLDSDIERQFAKIGQQIENLKFVPRDVFAVQIEAIYKRMDVIEHRVDLFEATLEETRANGKRWVGYLVAGILSVTGALIVVLVSNVAQ